HGDAGPGARRRTHAPRARGRQRKDGDGDAVDGQGPAPGGHRAVARRGPAGRGAAPDGRMIAPERVRRFPLRPPSEVEWEERLVRLEIAPRARPLAAEDARAADPALVALLQA